MNLWGRQETIVRGLPRPWYLELDQHLLRFWSVDAMYCVPDAETELVFTVTAWTRKRAVAKARARIAGAAKAAA